MIIKFIKVSGLFLGRWCEEEEWVACSNVFSFFPVVWFNHCPVWKHLQGWVERNVIIKSWSRKQNIQITLLIPVQHLCWVIPRDFLSQVPTLHVVLSLWRFTTKKCRLASENFDRRCMSKHITTEVPTLLLRHPIRESLGGSYDYQWLPNSDSQKPSRSCHFVCTACSIRSLFVAHTARGKTRICFRFRWFCCFFPLAW